MFLNRLKENKEFYINAYSYNGQNSLLYHHANRVYSFYYDLIEDIKNDVISESELFSLKVYVRGSMILIEDWINEQFSSSISQLENNFKVPMPENIKKYLVFHSEKWVFEWNTFKSFEF